MQRYLILISVCLAPCAIAVNQIPDQAPDLSDIEFNSREFQPPGGFGGYTWNTPLGQFDRLVSEPVYVRIAHSIGKVTYFDMSCYEAISGSRNTGIPLDHVAAMKACRETDGDGYHALAEYYVDSQ